MYCSILIRWLCISNPNVSFIFTISITVCILLETE